ncbi:hypothetical protein B0H11DRAFT_2243332 [Mycena galericulata]|nr:hypothetical protein B0H11DRAFT_2243332 [Mycena galericulata]
MSRHQRSLQPASGNAQSPACLEGRRRAAIHKLWILILAQRYFIRARNVSVTGAREAGHWQSFLRRRAEAMARIAAEYEKARSSA